MRFLNNPLLTLSVFGIGSFLFSSALNAQTRTYSPKLTEWVFLTSDDGAHLPAQRYADFLKLSPAWPLQSRITWRYEKALQQETRPLILKKLCPLFPPTQFRTLQQCHSYRSDTIAQARLLWRNKLYNAQNEQEFLSLYGSSLRAADQWARYQNLEHRGLKQAAERQISRLSPAQISLAKARFAQRFALPTADKLFASQSKLTVDADLIKLRLHFLRQKNRLDEGYHLWESIQSFPHNAPSAPLASEILAYSRLYLQSGQENDVKKALVLLTSLSRLPMGALRNDMLFLSGYSHLTFLNNSHGSESYFLELSHDLSLTNRAKGLYWLGRSHEAAGEKKQALSCYQKAASFPTVFEGQLAEARLRHSPFFDFTQRHASFKTSLHEKLSHIPQPAGGPIARTDLANAAKALAEHHEMKNATIFITYLYAHTHGSSALVSVAKLSAQLGIPKAAILSARKLAKAGIALYPAGYPTLYDVSTLSPLLPTVSSSLLRALIRQESSGDPNAESPSPAYGLMQLRLPTAQMVAHKHHLGTITINSLYDPQTNILLGSYYLSSLIERFKGNLPYALAAYNAGPGHVKTVSPTAPSYNDDDYLLKWITLFPFKETRGYIQNIISDMAVYANIAQ